MNRNSHGKNPLSKIVMKSMSFAAIATISLSQLQEIAYAQQAAKNNGPATKLSALPPSDKTQLYTYYGSPFAVDGHLIEPKKPNGPNFLACDQSLWTVVDFKKLQKSSRTGCGFSPTDEPGVVTAYFNSKKNGNVVLLTQSGKKSISALDWKKLLADYDDQMKTAGDKFSAPKVGDYVAFSTKQNGLIAQVYKLAKPTYPTTGVQ
jgi:hypothetical protein